MHLEIAKYFQHFYALIIKPKLLDSLIDSEWNYFISMFKGQSLQKDRLDLYFNIIENQRKIKPEAKPLHSLPSVKTNPQSTRTEEINKELTPIKHIQLPEYTNRGVENVLPQRAVSRREQPNSVSLAKRYSDNSQSTSPSISQMSQPSEIGRGSKNHKQAGSNLAKLAQLMKKLVVTYEQTHLQICRG